MNQSTVKQLIFDYYAKTKQEWLDQARKFAILWARQFGEVCADDIHELCPIPSDIDPRIMGSVFKGMVYLRHKKSSRARCHHRSIGVFTNEAKK